MVTRIKDGEPLEIALWVAGQQEDPLAALYEVGRVLAREGYVTNLATAQKFYDQVVKQVEQGIHLDTLSKEFLANFHAEVEEDRAIGMLADLTVTKNKYQQKVVEYLKNLLDQNYPVTIVIQEWDRFLTHVLVQVHAGFFPVILFDQVLEREKVGHHDLVSVVNYDRASAFLKKNDLIPPDVSDEDV